jgi:hypothetical protein
LIVIWFLWDEVIHHSVLPKNSFPPDPEEPPKPFQPEMLRDFPGLQATRSLLAK